jgi:hypothetical protein
MSYMIVLWIIWAALATVSLVLLAYRGTLTRYEEDCLFLDDCGGREQEEQKRILEKVRKIKPAVRAVTAATGVMTAAIIGLYLWQAVQQFNM